MTRKAHPVMPELREAIHRGGGMAEFVRRVGFPYRIVWQWINHVPKIPLNAVPFIVRAAADPRITPQTLRPDFAEGWALLAVQLAPKRVRKPAPDEETEAA